MSKPLSLPTHGFTLLEILIAIVVLSFGLMGLAGIQAAGIKNTHSANLRTLAVQQAYDMADRMRANAAGVVAGMYSALPATVPPTIPADPGCISSGCTPALLSAYDQRIWNLNNAAMLPAGTGGVVAIGAVPNIRYIITVMWDDYRTGAAGVGCGGNPAVDLTCFQVTFRP